MLSQAHFVRTLLMSLGNSNAAARTTIALRFEATGPACRPTFGAKTERIEEVVNAMLTFYVYCIRKKLYFNMLLAYLKQILMRGFSCSVLVNLNRFHYCIIC